MARNRSADVDNALYLRDLSGQTAQPSKAELRAEADALMARYKGEVKRLNSVVGLRCRTCGHRGTAHIRPEADAVPRFRCTRCGSSLVSYRV